MFKTLFFAVSMVISLLLGIGASAGTRVVKGKRIEPLVVSEEKSIDFLSETTQWKLTKGWKPLAPWRCADDKTAGKSSLRVRSVINLADGTDKEWPIALCALQLKPEKPFDWSAYDAIQLDVKLTAKKSKTKFGQLEIKVYNKDYGGSYKALIALKPSNKWRTVVVPFSYFAQSGNGNRMAGGADITQILLGYYENCLTHGAEFDLKMDNFKLLKGRPQPWTERCKSGTALGELYIGAAEEMTIIPAGTKQIPAVLGIVTGRNCFVTREYTVRINFHEMFSNKDYPLQMKCPGAVIPKAKAMIPVLLDIEKLPPGFYLTTFDILKNGKSIMKGRVGVDDFYIAKKGESTVHSLLSYQTAETYFAQDRKYGYMFKRVRCSLPHTWSPLDPKTYPQFLLAFARDSTFYIEDLHSSAITLTYAAEAFDRAGEPLRKAFAEKMLRDLMTFMTGPIMLQKTGTIVTSGCALADYDADKLPYAACAMKQTRIHDTSMSQTGYWFVCVTRAALYFAGRGNDMAYAKSFIPLLDNAAKFMTDNFALDIDGRTVLWNYHVLPDVDLKKWRWINKGPSGKPTQFCCGTRSLTSLAFYAYTRQLLAGSVPAHALTALKGTAEWFGDVLAKHDGFSTPNWEKKFFEPNMYLGEGYLGYYLYCKLIGDAKEAKRAAAWTNVTYRFITDKSTNWDGKGRVILEWNNWGGSWFTWSFGEYLQHIGPEPKLKWYVDKIEEKWRSRNFRDIRHRQWRQARNDIFQQIPKCPYLNVRGDIDASKILSYRSPDKGAIYLSFLGPLAIYDLRDMGFKSQLLTPIFSHPGANK